MLATKKNFLLATSTLATLAALAFVTPAAAQAEDMAAVTEVDEVVITGTRLRLLEDVQANPVVSLGSAQIETSGAASLGELLQEVPALVNSLDLSEGAATSTPDLAGISLLDLRNLGTDRTLVLVDGRRHVASYPGTSAVDVNSIPMALIERVDVLTGGASAVYGADGVSGVVNFIMKKDFEGVDVRAQHGWTEEGGGGASLFSGVVGHNFADGRANAAFAYEYANQDRLTYRDRSYTSPGRREILVSNPDDPGTFGAGLDDPNIPDNILSTDVRYINASPSGAIYTNILTAASVSGASFIGDGNPFVDGQYAGGSFMIGGSGTPRDLFNDDLLPGLERHAFNVTGRYEVSPALSLWGDAKLVRTSTAFQAQPSYDFALFISPENPFLPANVLANAEDIGGLASNIAFPVAPGVFLTPWQIIGLPAPGVLVGRDNFDLGTQTYEVERETVRFAAGATIAITPTVDLELSAVAGRARQDLAASNVRINERFLAATDVVIDPATNQPACRSNLDPGALPIGDLNVFFDPSTFGATFTPGPDSGCLPLNIFGEGVADPAAIDWINTSSESNAEIGQDVLTAYLTGDTGPWFSLPAGPLSFVLGGEYRREEAEFQPAPIQALAQELGYPGFSTAGAAASTEGGFDVREAFMEVAAPIVRDLPWAQSVTVQGAYRWSDYSNMGETHTWNVGGKWRINEAVMLRATRARAVRAPNIQNLYLGRTPTFGEFGDPCSVENLGAGENPELRRQNCAAVLEALDVDPDTFIADSGVPVGGFISGNPDLKPEEADTLTWGAVLTPSFAPGLSMSVDYYDIEITDAIQSFGRQAIVDNCYDLPQPNSFCALLERTGGGFNPGRIVSLEQMPQNVATYRTRGIDYTLNYRLDPSVWGVGRDLGYVDLRVVGNVLKELTFDEGGTAAPVNNLGAQGAPEQQLTLDATWTWNALRVNYGLSWFDETRRFPRATMANEPDYVEDGLWYYPARELHDLQVRYSIQQRYSLYGGVNNLTDQKPVWDDYNYPVSPQGRTVYVGLQAEF